MNRFLILVALLFMHFGAMAQKNQRTLFLNTGLQNSWERDHGYSPLVYKGSSIGLTLGYASVGELKTDEVYLHYSRLPLQNAFNAEMTGTHASVITYTFYSADWLPESLMLGWSNNNALSERNYEDAQNFNPRFDFHTSFGPAVRYQQSFGKEQEWRFSSQAHWQVIGFLFSASYVTSPPDPFLHEQSTFNAFWQSLRFFQPFQQQDLGILNQFFYQLSNGNEIGIGHRFHYSSLENAHRSHRSGSHYFFQLNFQL
ncbi:hypothetical protein [Pleomorphovibrio marinus]|uniref:hypothetical protein n=1 Tax=Pleomorphovibrio marinus TaxID=2164132 RepID=UPI000E0A279B|nr:hypothetical protein [Pleomorphovibrio marinus]